MIEIVSIVDEGLGHSSHVLGLGDGTALVVDPARFPTAQRRLVAERGWTLAWTADTHSHADYISGSPELAAEGATFLLGALAGTVVPDAPLTVMCGHGERAMTGASILEASGHHNLSVLTGGPGEWQGATGIALRTD